MNNCTICNGDISKDRYLGVQLNCGHNAHAICEKVLEEHDEKCPRCAQEILFKDPVTVSITREGTKTFFRVERDSKLIDILTRIQEALNFAAPEDVQLVYKNPRMANPQVVSPFRTLKEYVEDRKEVELAAKEMSFPEQSLSSLSSTYQLNALYGLTNPKEVASLYKEKIHSNLV